MIVEKRAEEWVHLLCNHSSSPGQQPSCEENEQRCAAMEVTERTVLSIHGEPIPHSLPHRLLHAETSQHEQPVESSENDARDASDTDPIATPGKSHEFELKSWHFTSRKELS